MHRQIAAGQNIQISRPDRLLIDEEGAVAVQTFRRKLLSALNGLLDTVIDPAGKTTIRDELGELGGGVRAFLHEQLRTRGLQNEHLEAETLLILERVNELRARTAVLLREADAQSETRHLANIDRKIELVRKLLGMAADIEPNALIRLYADFPEPRQLADHRQALLSTR